MANAFSERQRLLSLLTRRDFDASQKQFIPRRASAEPLPLSFGQQRLWLIDQMEPGSAAYNIPVAARLTGRLNLFALEQSLTAIVNRHEVLRTVFVAHNGEAVQIINPSCQVMLPVISLGELQEDVREREIRRLMSEEAERPFDLSRGPLIRCMLLQSGEQNFTLSVNMHHIISDGWSISVFVRELGVFYHAFSSGTSTSLPVLPIQYADFAIWQRRCMQEQMEPQLAYWKKQLAGAPPTLRLPADRLRPATNSSREHTFPFNSRLNYRIP